MAVTVINMLLQTYYFVTIDICKYDGKFPFTHDISWEILLQEKGVQINCNHVQSEKQNDESISRHTFNLGGSSGTSVFL
jgi:hypothetical protein